MEKTNSVDSNLRFKCLELAKELLIEGMFVCTTSKQGNSRKQLETVIEKFEENFVLLDRSSGDELNLINFKGNPKIKDVIYFGNKLYKFCIENENGLEKIISEIEDFNKKKIEKEEKEAKEKLERINQERKNEENRLEELKVEFENSVSELESFLFSKTGKIYRLDRSKTISSLKEYAFEELIENF